ncbi:unnamed protein product [Acanthocheilonema viteae]|uniref:Eukaryotic porin n=1 Tax=Acanthocheilonema viteae TaxID=6277 RepID=A0A498S4W9_ACAVI|nr:unnamed protein product [Acanthocheilonema viteae]
MSTSKSTNAPVDSTQAGGLVDGPEKNTTSARVYPPVTTSSNPGSLEEIHRKCREIFPMCFDGARMMLTKAMSSHFQVTHTLSVSPQNTGYRFGATYVGTKTTQQEGENFPVFLADTDISGNTSATFLHQFGDRWRVKMQAQTQGNKLATTQGGVEYRGRLTTLGLTCANIDIINDSGVIVAQYLRRITKKLDLGVEFIHQYGIPIPGRQLSVLNYQARAKTFGSVFACFPVLASKLYVYLMPELALSNEYTGKNFIASGMFSFDALHLCYYHKQRENISFGVEFESSTRSGEAVANIGYQAEIPDEGVVMRASVNTDWAVGAVFEKKLSRNLPFTLAISGMLNHVKGQGKFGIGLIIDAMFDSNNALDLTNPLNTVKLPFQMLLL